MLPTAHKNDLLLSDSKNIINNIIKKSNLTSNKKNIKNNLVSRINNADFDEISFSCREGIIQNLANIQNKTPDVSGAIKVIIESSEDKEKDQSFEINFNDFKEEKVSAITENNFASSNINILNNKKNCGSYIKDNVVTFSRDGNRKNNFNKNNESLNLEIGCVKEFGLERNYNAKELNNESNLFANMNHDNSEILALKNSAGKFIKEKANSKINQTGEENNLQNLMDNKLQRLFTKTDTKKPMQNSTNNTNPAEKFNFNKNSDDEFYLSSYRKFVITNPKKKENMQQLAENKYGQHETSINKKSQIVKNRYENSHLEISAEKQISLLGTKEVIENPKKMPLNIQTRSFTFPCKDSSIFFCQKITILPVSKFNDIVNLIKSSAKIILIFAIYLNLWFYIAVFVESIYKQYGNNVFKICVMPLISMLFIKLVIVINIMLLIATTILYFYGKTFLNKGKNNLFAIIIFKALVPPMALNHFSAILNYQSFMKINN